MNILDFKKMNILFEWIFWIFIKWIIFWSNILVLVCLRQKRLSPNVSNSSEITHGSLVGPISVHFRGLLPILGPQEGSEAISWPHLGFWIIFLIFFEWMILLNVLDSIEWIIFWMNILNFVLNWIIFRPDSMKYEFSKRIAQGYLPRGGWNIFLIYFFRGKTCASVDVYASARLLILYS